MIDTEYIKVRLFIEGGVGIGRTVVKYKFNAHVPTSQIIQELIKEFNLNKDLIYFLFLETDEGLSKIDNFSTLHSNGIRDGQMLEFKAFWTDETIKKISDISSNKITLGEMVKPTDKQRLVTIINDTGGERATMCIPINENLELLSLAIAKKLGLSLDHTYELSKYRSYEAFQGYFKDTDIANGDILTLYAIRTAGGGIPLYGSYENFQIITARLEHANNQLSNSYKMFAIFLYSEADKTISSFVREHFLELHFMAGANTVFFVVEQPKEEWMSSIKKDLQEKLGELSERIIRKIEAKQLKPITSELMYLIANRFGIKKKDLPCIVFFTEVESRKILHIPFDSLLDSPLNKADENQILSMFRKLFDAIDTVAEENQKSGLDELDKSIILNFKMGNRIKQLFGSSWALTLDESIKAVIGGVVKLIIFGH